MIRRLLWRSMLALALLLTGFNVVVHPSVSAIGSTALRSILKQTPYYGDVEAKAGCSADATTGDVALSGADNRQAALNYFVSKGLTDIQAAGIIGNLMQESRLNTHAFNPPSAATNGIGHRGIAQWSDPGRWTNLVNAASQKGADEFSLEMQLSYVWTELSGSYSGVLNNLKSANTVEDATKIIDDGYEVSGGAEISNRIAFAKQVLGHYGGSESGTVAGSGASCGSVGAVDCTSGESSASGLSQVRQNVVCVAEAELKLWESGQMKVGTDFGKYSQGRTSESEEWCADFASWVYNQAGYPIRQENSGNVPAVATVKATGEAGDRFVYHPAGGYTPSPGDLVIYSPSHVNIVVSVNQNASTFEVIGGNQSGSTTSNKTSKVTKYTVGGYSGSYYGSTIVGYVSPKE